MKRTVIAALLMLAFAPGAHAAPPPVVTTLITLDGKPGFSGPAGTQIAPAGGIVAIVDTYGHYAGTNLFHSFQTFNLGQGDTATFSGLAGTGNIVARVTGGSASSIYGTLASSIDGANLWFLNPSGIVFGPYASLNLTGSFHASTATSLKFGTNGSFDMVNPPANTLIVDPTAFGFLGPAAPITLNQTWLVVNPGKDISLVGGNIILNGGTDPFPGAKLVAQGGRVNIASVSSAGEVSIDGPLAATGVTKFGDISMSNALVLTEATGANHASGPIYIVGGSLTLDNTAISTLNRGGTNVAADISIDLTRDFSMNGSLVRTSSIGSGDAGNFTLHAASVSLANDSIIDASAADLASHIGGNAGRTTIVATGDITLSDHSALTSISYYGGGAAGQVEISGRNLTLSGGSNFQSSIYGDGTGASITLNVASLRLSGGSFVSASTEYDNNGIPGSAPGGSINVSASGPVSISGSGSGLFSFTTSFGDGGTINVSAGSIGLASGAQISTRSGDAQNSAVLGGNAGSITLTANTIDLSGGSSITTESAHASGGGITISAAERLSLDHNSQITTSVHIGNGNGGDITIDPVFLVLNGSRIAADTFDGTGGHIDIVAQNLIMSPGSAITADALGPNGVPGVVEVSSPNVDAGSALGKLPSAYFDPSAMLRAACAAKVAQAASSFVAGGRGGLPAGPDAAGFGFYALGTTPINVLATTTLRRGIRSGTALQGCSA
jgi:filamentous hemagglutinin family protein